MPRGGRTAAGGSLAFSRGEQRAGQAGTIGGVHHCAGCPCFSRDKPGRPGLNRFGGRTAATTTMPTKLTMLAGLLCLGLGLTVALAADPEQQPERKKRSPRPPDPERLLKRYDKDDDGALSKEELEKLTERKRDEIMKEWDKDNDGALSKAELAAMKATDEEEEPAKERRRKRDKEEDQE